MAIRTAVGPFHQQHPLAHCGLQNKKARPVRYSEYNVFVGVSHMSCAPTSQLFFVADAAHKQ
ncbi:hypothetical protein RvY_17504 [Ramazzottius varieornatus]|uniref:Uncharacterized protein n=1 Tax=Ramazzottius varieornatus TaxID=947166 RepID=A0A1D1W855_RAMVA|nr:hypothetical protein RvY_17504 [Ramazzottius varieornatus]